jgi:hypothetical protein
MGDWARDTRWRQGFVLSAESAKAIGIQHPESPDKTLVLVISHDCDLASPPAKEPDCEVIVGAETTADARLANAKNIRVLQLEFANDDEKIIGEFRADRKQAVSKSVMPPEPPIENEKIHLAPDDLRTLRTWLAARYRRSSFPDSFDPRMKHKKFAEKIERVLKDHGKHVLAMLFNVDDGHGSEKPDDETYTLEIYLVYRSANDPDASGDAEQAAQSLEKLFRERFFTNGQWHGIELVGAVNAMSDSVMTIALANSLDQWYADYISLAEDPQGAMMADPATHLEEKSFGETDFVQVDEFVCKKD